MEKSEFVFEEDGHVFVIRPANGVFSSDDLSIALKALKKFLKGEFEDMRSERIKSNQKGNGHSHNGGNTNSHSSWLLTWLAEANGYRDGYPHLFTQH
jgi:hypothetical protein